MSATLFEALLTRRREKGRTVNFDYLVSPPSGVIDALLSTVFDELGAKEVQQI